MQANAEDVAVLSVTEIDVRRVSVSVFVLTYASICVRTLQANAEDVAVLSVTEIDARRAPAIKVNLQVRSQLCL